MLIRITFKDSHEFARKKIFYAVFIQYVLKDNNQFWILKLKSALYLQKVTSWGLWICRSHMPKTLSNWGCARTNPYIARFLDKYKYTGTFDLQCNLPRMEWTMVDALTKHNMLQVKNEYTNTWLTGILSNIICFCRSKMKMHEQSMTTEVLNAIVLGSV